MIKFEDLVEHRQGNVLGSSIMYRWDYQDYYQTSDVYLETCKTTEEAWLEKARLGAVARITKLVKQWA